MAKFFRFRSKRLIIIDVDTQRDLLDHDGIDRIQLKSNIRRIIAWARVKKIPVISTCLTIRNDHTPDETTSYEPVCVEDTPGAKKISYTLLHNRLEYLAENRLDLPENLLETYRQIIFNKRVPDPFECPRADRMISDIRADDFIVFGTQLDTSLLKTVLGLRQREKKVSVVVDAIDMTHSIDPDMTLRKIQSKGARLITTESLAGVSRLTSQRQVNKTHQRRQKKNRRVADSPIHAMQA